MALNFPDSPADGATFTDATTGETWTYEASTNSWTSEGLTTAAGIIYKGGIDITAAAPAGAKSGWQYTVTTGGTAHAGFTGLSGNIPAGTTVLFDGTNWQRAGAGVVWIRSGTSITQATIGDKLQLKVQDGTNQKVSVDLDAGAHASPLVRDASGRLLVGTTTSPTKDSGQYARIVAQGYTGDATGGGYISLQRGQLATGMSGGVEVGVINFGDSEGSSFAKIVARADSPPGASDFPGRLTFSTTPSGSATPEERVRIDSTGKVGIGTVNPSTVLDVRQANTGGEAKVSVFNLDTADTTTQTAIVGLSPDSRASAVTGIEAYKDNADFSANTGRNISLAFNVAKNNAKKEAGRFDSTGRLLVGATSAFNSGSNALLQLSTAGSTSVSVQRRNANSNAVLGHLNFWSSAGECASVSASTEGTQTASTASPGRLSFSTTPTGTVTPVERMRISHNGIAYFFSSDAGLVSNVTAAAGNSEAIFTGRHSATDTLSGTNCFIVRSNGDVENTNNIYRGISDIKLKENIVDAKSQWDDIKGLRVVNYNFKPETGAETHKQLGLIAQEVEQVCPGLVGESKDMETVEVPVLDADGKPVLDDDGNPQVTYEERETGEVTKNVNYSVLYMKAVGALQEAMTRIEQLEAKVTALESK